MGSPPQLLVIRKGAYYGEGFLIKILEKEIWENSFSKWRGTKIKKKKA